MSLKGIKIFVAFFALFALLALGTWLSCGNDEGDSLSADDPKFIVVAMDGLDPLLLEQWMNEGVLPNFSRLRAQGDFKPLGTSIPPQSPVAWSNFITGQNPGGHGIFDFIHRDPNTYLPFLSTTKTEAPKKFWKIAGYKIPSDEGQVTLMRKGKAFWEYLGEAGILTTIFSIPSNFPPVQGNFRSLSGMGTPDLLGGYGTFSYYTDSPPKLAGDEEMSGGRVYQVTPEDNSVKGEIFGPPNTFMDLPEDEMPPDSKVPFTVYVDPDADAAILEVSGERHLLNVGDWTDWIQLDFEMVPMVVSVKGMVRFLLRSAHPEFKLYVSAINIDPREPAMPISTPDDYANELAEAIGHPYHTQGIPEDTKALSKEVFNNEEFLQQAHTILSERMAMYTYELERFKSGLLFFYFSSTDQITHMFWRTMDHSHPAYVAAEDEPYTDVIKDTYERLDKALGMAMEKAGTDTTLLVMSDHGFAPYYQSFHLSSWLVENGYLMLQDPSDRKSEFNQNVEWMGTKAYTLGINGLYINLIGREAQGIVSPMDADKLTDEIAEKLLAITDPENGQKVISHVYKTRDVYTGPNKKNAPDMIIGYARGYRASWETALGAFPPAPLLRPNTDEWSGDHCMATEEIPGTVMSNRKIVLKDPKLYDLPVTILETFGLARPGDMIGRNIFTGN